MLQPGIHHRRSLVIARVSIIIGVRIMVVDVNVREGIVHRTPRRAIISYRPVAVGIAVVVDPE
jgi:hypothetical protein